MKRALVVLATAALIVVGLGIFLSGSDEAVRAYRFGHADRGPLETVVTASGTVTPVISVEVSSQLSGQVSELFVDFNDRVTRGQPLARLDPRTFQSQVEERQAELAMAQSKTQKQEATVSRARALIERTQAEARVAAEKTKSVQAQSEFAGQDLRRKQELKNRNIVTGADADEAKANHAARQADLRAAQAEEIVRRASVATARADLLIAESDLADARGSVLLMQARLASAQIELDRSIIRSPIDGLVIKRNVKLGQTVAASLRAPTLFTLAQDLRRMEVEASIDEADIGRVKVGQRANFSVDAYVGRTFTGQIEEIRKAPEVFQNVVTYTVVVGCDNGELLLYPGMTASVRIVVSEVTDALRVPNAALRFLPHGRESVEAGVAERVWVADASGAPKPIPVRTGITDSVRTEIRDGTVEPGSRLIIGIIPGQDTGVLTQLAEILRVLMSSVGIRADS